MIPRLHLITNDEILASPGFQDAALRSIAAGAERMVLHLRGPGTSGRRLSEVGEELLPWCREHGVPILVNDRVDVALALGLDGVHLGARSFPVEDARALLGEGVILGRSVHGRVEAEETERERGEGRGVDFVLAGTIFPTPSHLGRAGRGVSLIPEVAKALPGVPVIGIGGVTEEQVPALMAAEAHGVAVVRAVWGAANPESAVRDLLAQLDRAQEAKRRG